MVCSYRLWGPVWFLAVYDRSKVGKWGGESVDRSTTPVCGNLGSQPPGLHSRVAGTALSKMRVTCACEGSACPNFNYSGGWTKYALAGRVSFWVLGFNVGVVCLRTNLGSVQIHEQVKRKPQRIASPVVMYIHWPKYAFGWKWQSSSGIRWSRSGRPPADFQCARSNDRPPCAPRWAG